VAQSDPRHFREDARTIGFLGYPTPKFWGVCHCHSESRTIAECLEVVEDRIILIRMRLADSGRHCSMQLKMIFVAGSGPARQAKGHDYMLGSILDLIVVSLLCGRRGM
jgi:hypothetical protein